MTAVTCRQNQRILQFLSLELEFFLVGKCEGKIQSLDLKKVALRMKLCVVEECLYSVRTVLEAIPKE